MKKFKQIISITLCFFIILTACAVSASAATTIEYGDFTLSVNGDGTYSLYKYNGTSIYVQVPAKANDMPIVAISSYSFEDTPAKYILLNDNIKTIDNYAFYGAENLISIWLPSSVTSIGNSAFGACTSLITVDFSDAVAVYTLPTGIFQGCTSLKKFTIPNTIKKIESNAFYSSGLEFAEIPDSVTSLGEYAFYGCTNLASVKLPTSITALEKYTFYGCTALTEVAIPQGVTSIGNRCFYGCSALAQVDIPLSCTSIGARAFYDCTALTSVFVPKSVSSIGSSCFSPMDIEKKFIVKGFSNSYVEEYCSSLYIDFESVDALIGDANMDGRITINDVTAIQKELAHLSTLSSSLARALADNNSDNNLSIRDATRIQMYLAKYIDEF